MNSYDRDRFAQAKAAEIDAESPQAAHRDDAVDVGMMLARDITGSSWSAPVTDGENVYVLFKELGLLSYTAAGKLRRKVPIDPHQNSQGLGASPILAGDNVLILADQLQGSYIAAYSKSNGELRWKIAREESEGWATPILDQPPGQPLQIVTASGGNIGGHLASSGKRTFSFPGASPAIIASPVIDGHSIIAFGYGAPSFNPFSTQLETRDKNKDGKITRDEFTHADNTLNSIAGFIGNRDGDVTKDEWIEWGKVVGGGTAMLSL